MVRVPDELYRRFPQTHVSPGDLLIASLGDARNHAGRACVAPVDLGPAMVKGKCYVAKADELIASEEFLAILMSSPVGAEQLVSQGSGATRSMLNFDRLLSTPVPIPPHSEQQRLVAAFETARAEMDKGVTCLSRSVELLEEYKQSLITAAVTGGLDVTTVGSGIPG